MRQFKVAVLLGAVVLVGCVPDDQPKPAAPPAIPAPPAPAGSSREELKQAVMSVYYQRCHIMSAEERDDLVRQRALVENAGEALVPALAELVAEYNFRYVDLATSVGMKYPLSESLRAALRTRRDNCYHKDRYSIMEDFFLYFAKFGDETDLVWMERAVSELDEADRPKGQERLRELRGRLATN